MMKITVSLVLLGLLCVSIYEENYLLLLEDTVSQQRHDCRAVPAPSLPFTALWLSRGSDINSEALEDTGVNVSVAAFHVYGYVSDSLSELNIFLLR